jgi:hypothetical protein
MTNRVWLITTFLSLLIAASSARAADPDPFLAPADKSTANPSALPSDTPAPSLGSETPTNALKPSPEEQPPMPVNSIPGKTQNAPAADSAKAGKKDIYDEYYDYLNSDQERRTDDKDISMRNFFPHEDGALQLSLLYSLTAFNGYNFNFQPNLTTKNGAQTLFGKTQGGTIGLDWFPIRSFTVGRLGFGVNAGIFWTRFDVPTTSTVINPATGVSSTGPAITSSKPQNIISYGVRATYELDYWLAQIFVPYAFVGADEMAIQSFSVSAGNATYVSIPRRQLVSEYWGAGARFYLNRVEPVVGSRALVNVGIRKFYLAYSYIQRNGDIAGGTHSLGLTFEF